MSEGPRLVEVGISGSTPVFADVRVLGSDVPVSVTLTAPYTMLQPIGFPFRPSFTGAAAPQYPHTLPSGMLLSLLACEATALKAAGGAI